MASEFMGDCRLLAGEEGCALQDKVNLRAIEGGSVRPWATNSWKLLDLRGERLQQEIHLSFWDEFDIIYGSGIEHELRGKDGSADESGAGSEGVCKWGGVEATERCLQGGGDEGEDEVYWKGIERVQFLFHEHEEQERSWPRTEFLILEGKQVSASVSKELGDVCVGVLLHSRKGQALCF